MSFLPALDTGSVKKIKAAYKKRELCTEKRDVKKRILAAVLAAALFFSNFGLQDKVRAVYAEEVSEEAVEEISLQTEASEGSLITGSSEEKEEASKMIDETDSKNSDVENMDIESMDDKDSTVSEEEKTDTSETKRKEEQKNKDLDSKWYVLDRPMTEEEKQEQLDLIEYYRSFNGVVEEESGSILEDGFGYGIASTEEEIPHLILQSEDSYQIPSSYSSKEKGYMPYIRTQVQGICWTFAPLASIEINLIKNNIFTKEEMDLSENHTVYSCCSGWKTSVYTKRGRECESVQFRYLLYYSGRKLL